ncbi:uncharacterized protein LOC144715681 isoform X2 [Wolffia australiana]
MASPQSGDIILPLSSQKHDPAWKHCHMIKRGDRIHLRCMYCHKLFSGGGIHRIKEHLACQKGNASSCPKVNADVRRSMQQSLDGAVMQRRKKQKLAEEVKKLHPLKPEDDDGQSEGDTRPLLVALPEGAPINPARKKRRAAKISLDRDQVQLAIARFLYEAEVPLEAVNSAYFQPMIDAIAGPGLKGPSFHDLRGCLLKNSLGEMKSTIEFYKETWAKTGCSVLADEWVAETDQTLINFLVYCPEGLVFLKSLDASQVVASPDALFELLKLVVEEVGVTNVIQVVTNVTETHAMAGKRLSEVYPSLFWNPCAARCVDAMLEDIAKLEPVRVVLEHARSLTRFVYRHAEVLNMVRRITEGEELVFLGRSPAETAFGTLSSVAGFKEKLVSMVTSEEWNSGSFSTSVAAADVAHLVCSPGFWSSLESLVQLTEPLLKVLKMADSVERPAMGYLYSGLRQAKEMVKRVMKRKRDYLPYWNIIDGRWLNEQRGGLQAAGFFFNPQLYYSLKGKVPNEVMTGVLDCIERLVPEMKSQDRINKELTAYKNAAGDFGRKMAIRARQTLLPGEWWSTYGGACPNLARLAIRILSQTCSARGWERSRRPFEEMHSRRKNHLENQRLCDLIFVRYNLRLQQRHLVKKSQSDPLSVEAGNGVEDWTVERNNVFAIEDESSWMELTQPKSPSGPHRAAEEDDVFTHGIDEVCFGSDVDGEEEDDVYVGCKEDEMVYVKQDVYGFVKDDE